MVFQKKNREITKTQNKTSVLQARGLAPLFLGGFVLLLGLVTYLWQWRKVMVFQKVQLIQVDTAQVKINPTELETVALTLVDAQGLERTMFEVIEMPQNATASQRYEHVLQSLRSAMLVHDDNRENSGQKNLNISTEAIWPVGFTLEKVYVITEDNGNKNLTAVIDMILTEELFVSVKVEQALLTAITKTLQYHGVDEVRFLHDGNPPTVFLRHLQVSPAL